jgi:NAD(P)-dependent dehydrogenase (short-subunit alcohol dehydrogenase family)
MHPAAPELVGQTVVVIGGSAGIALEAARRARVEGAGVILTGRNPERLKQAVMVTAGAPHYGPPLKMSPEEARPLSASILGDGLDKR